MVMEQGLVMRILPVLISLMAFKWWMQGMVWLWRLKTAEETLLRSHWKQPRYCPSCKHKLRTAFDQNHLCDKCKTRWDIGELQMPRFKHPDYEFRNRRKKK